nr:MAG TPA: hypothetical protein [Caudoviricetes sp.]
MLLEGWETVSGVRKLSVNDLFLYGIKAVKYAKQRERRYNK